MLLLASHLAAIREVRCREIVIKPGNARLLAKEMGVWRFLPFSASIVLGLVSPQQELDLKRPHVRPGSTCDALQEA